MKYSLLSLLFIVCGSSFARAQGVCENQNPIRTEVCFKMRNLQAGIHAVDAQRELMQANPAFYLAAGNSLSTTAKAVLKIIGPGIPEHQMGLSGVSRLGEEIAIKAQKNDMDMLVAGNKVRANCATCHANENPSGGVTWDDIFNSDWSKISLGCSEPGKNPYLCRSMNGMLSSYSYMLTGYAAKMEDFAMTGQSAEEIARVLADLKAKNFKHLPEELRAKAESDAREVSLLAEKKDPSVFQKAIAVADTCKKCHEEKLGALAPGAKSFSQMLTLMNWVK